MSKRTHQEVITPVHAALVPLRQKLDEYRVAREDAAFALKERVDARMLQIVEARITAMLDVLAD
jgi:hypothetical protein